MQFQIIDCQRKKVDVDKDVHYNRHIINETTIGARNKMINSNTVKALLSNVKGTTFANLVTVTNVGTSAANKATVIKKHTTAQVMLFNGIKDYDIYAKAVMRTANSIDPTETSKLADFEVSASWFTHDMDCHSIVSHNKTGKEYLYAVFNNSKSSYTVDGVPATKALVATYLTPSAAKLLLNPPALIYNVKNDVHHTVFVRTVLMESIVSITAMKQVIHA